jgi:peptidoglycan biosynthesis protein MviN/MurJ (putative lipid II flippase)
MIFVIGQGIGFGVGTGLHALGAARRSLRTAILGSALHVVCALAGAVAAGAAGTVWGMAVAACISAVYGWWQLLAANRASG